MPSGTVTATSRVAFGSKEAQVLADELEHRRQRQHPQRPRVECLWPVDETTEDEHRDERDRVQHEAAPAHPPLADGDAATVVVRPVVAQPERRVVAPTADHGREIRAARSPTVAVS